jgi:hypothetical protein
MRRRDVLTLLGGAVTAWPLVARAQQAAMPVIGFLYSQSPEGSTESLRGFRQGLKDAGFLEGDNVAIEYSWAENQTHLLPALAAELVRRRVAVIAAMDSNSAPPPSLHLLPSPSCSALARIRSSSASSLASPGQGAILPASIFSPQN